MFAEDYEINDQQLTIEQQMIENKEIINYELYDSMAALADLIKKNEISDIQQTIKKYASYINCELVEYMYDNQKIFFEFNYMLDVLKSKINSYDKDSEERLLLKEIQKQLKDIYNSYKKQPTQDKTSPYFNIIEYWLHDEDNYLYIRDLLNRKHEVYNVYNGDQHIVIYILDQYIENFKKMINDKNGTYINKNYLKEVYYLFTKNYQVRLNEEQKQEIDTKLKEFSIYIKNTLIKQKRKSVALDDLKKLKTCNHYPTTVRYEFRNFNDDQLSYEQQKIFNFYQARIKDSLATPAFQIGDNAYRIYKKKDAIVLKMYSVDVHQFVPEGSIMNHYLEKCAYNKEEIDSFFTKKLKFNEKGKYPVICYNLEFYLSGKVKSLTIDNDVVMITEKHNTIYNMDDNLKEFYDLYKKSIIKNGGTMTDYNIYQINNHFEQLLNQKYVEFVKNNKLPFIYYGYSLANPKEVEKQLGELSKHFYELSKRDAKDIINIIECRIDPPHYSILPIENGVYDLKLLDSFNYLGLENQRMLGDLQFNQRKLESPLRLYKLKLEYLNKYYNKVNDLNKHMEYVDRFEIKESKGKIKRKLRI